MLSKKYKDNTSEEVLVFMGEELRRFRTQANIESASWVAKELNMGHTNVYMNEWGRHLISVRSLKTLLDFYGLNQRDREYLLELRQLVIDKRKEEKEQENGR